MTLRQAYIALRTPLGNGIDWKIGVFDTIVGYESTTTLKQSKLQPFLRL